MLYPVTLFTVAINLNLFVGLLHFCRIFLSFFLFFFFFNVGEENQRLRLKERKGEEESGFMGHPQDATLHTQLVLSCHTHEVTRVF